MRKNKAMLVPHVIFGVFGEKNQRVFNGVETPLECLKDNFISTLFGTMKRFARPLLMWPSVWIACILDVHSLV